MIRPVSHIVPSEVFITLTPLGYIVGKNNKNEHLVLSPNEYINGNLIDTVCATILVLAGDKDTYDVLRVEHYFPNDKNGEQLKESASNGKLSLIDGQLIPGNSLTSRNRRDHEGELEQLACEHEPKHLEAYEQTKPRVLIARGENEQFVVSTDASKSNRGKEAGWGFVIDSNAYDKLLYPHEHDEHQGQYFKSGIVRCKNIGEAEAYAIAKSYEWFMRRTKGKFSQLTIRTDSFEAIRIITQGTKASLPRALGGRFYRMVEQLKKDIESNKVSLVKVKAHRDDYNNNQADRVAVATRRAHDAGMEKNKIKQHVKNALVNMDFELQMSGNTCAP